MTEHVDVLIVGAGLSGVGAACHLEERLPGTSYLLLEMRDGIGGTWDLFRYPGIRSDSDMFTMGYRFRPWTGSQALADGRSILDYVRTTAREHGVDAHVRYRQRVVAADWSREDDRWTVTVEADGTQKIYTCGFLWCCSGYYDYAGGYSPELTGIDDFEGQVVHPQAWPDDLDHTGRQVVVIGSGATAVTLVPALAQTAAHVTMLQRSPTYVLSLPRVDRLDQRLKELLPDSAAYAVTRWKHILVATAFYQVSRRWPEFTKRVLRKGVVSQLPPDYDVGTHFTPAYDPWDQRMCFVPDGDLFRALRHGDAEVVTDRIATFTRRGIRLESGREIPADIVVTATGLNLLAFGGMRLSVDGEEVDVPHTMSYRGLMLSGVPNFAYVIGYTNASWTLKADLVSEWVCRLLVHLRDHGWASAEPVRDPDVEEEPLLDFSSGYVQRSLHLLPKAGSRLPWKLRMNYLRDLVTIRRAPIEDGVLRFTRPRVRERVSA
jgi:cation diffusion facilitator CzcD-associated flavoprotein CzcO